MGSSVGEVTSFQLRLRVGSPITVGTLVLDLS